MLSPDCFQPWSEKSESVPFTTSKKCVGNGEQKLVQELEIPARFGGQNNVFDLIHPQWGYISIKDMTNDDFTLGAEGCVCQ